MKDKNRIQSKKNVKETLALVFISTDFAALLIQLEFHSNVVTLSL